MSLIDQASAYKVNTLHLHVSDDQGFRIVINGFPNLTDIGSHGSVGTGRPHDGPRRLLDPGRLPCRCRPRGSALHDGRA